MVVVVVLLSPSTPPRMLRSPPPPAIRCRAAMEGMEAARGVRGGVGGRM